VHAAAAAGHVKASSGFGVGSSAKLVAGKLTTRKTKQQNRMAAGRHADLDKLAACMRDRKSAAELLQDNIRRMEAQAVAPNSVLAAVSRSGAEQVSHLRAGRLHGHFHAAAVQGCQRAQDQLHGAAVRVPHG